MASKNKYKSKFFRVATEGDTTDGRVIERNWIEQAAANFNQATYGARVWLEHIRGLYADSDFKAYGDVTALKAEEVDGKMALFAQIDPTNDLVKMNKDRQKIYTSIEIDPNFAKTGEAYLVGLAVTDSPASLSTEMLSFSAGAQQNPLASRKLRPDNLFTAAQEVQLEWEECEQPEGPSLFNRVKALLNQAKDKNKADLSDVSQAVLSIAEQTAESTEQVATFNNKIIELESTINDLTTAQKTAEEKFNQLEHQLSHEEQIPPRNPASGGNATTPDFL
ncbi:GPO family capsid scaffolding protein [Motilimonas sp. 1_MG-2023]|uniref:GPO family capsid scaffolding protein n=1 Tax=Motilimonas sp. 1_MG-2023 TaxID=3062672 RepID=UPI0026E421CF|nr:GPO family capsid scaffolding protein [Motilimonas sp. 1_MG-2023]MDO6525450.1 GPO family capsid scaffolding protein [Motilimonas sp. 1_MG-2023]